MGFLGGVCRCTLAAAVVPLAIVLAIFLEKPSVTQLDVSALPADEGSAPAAAEAAAAKELEFGTAVKEGFGSGGMFDRIAFVYDSTNKWMSLGLDQYWRKTMIQECMTLQKGDRVLDLATGTADVSLLAGTTLSKLSDGALPADSVLGVDPSSEMLRRGVSKVDGQGLTGGVRLVKGDAQDLTSVRGINAEGTLSDPSAGVASDSIDKISIAFGIRNVPDRSLAFREMKRVLQKRRSSRVCILEFSLPSGETFLSAVAKKFITHVIPFIGRVATMNSGSTEYEYLERSILKFPQPKDFAAEMARDGLTVNSITTFAFGAVNLYTASPAGV